MTYAKKRRRKNTEETVEDLRYDKNVKNVLAIRQILAPILKKTVSAFQHLSLEVIANDCIEGTPWVGEVPVDPGRTNRRFHRRIPPKIRGSQTEQSDRDEGWVTFDVLFYAQVPGTGERIKFIINVEAQRQNTNYKQIKRAVFYATRLVSSQKEREFDGQDYDGICKVYSIWLCFYLPRGETSSINQYELTENNIYGDHHETKEDYDLLNVTTLHIGDDEPTDELLQFLKLVFVEQMTEQQKTQRIKEEFGIELETEARKELETMCNLSAGLKERARVQGEEIGEARGKVLGAEQAWIASVKNLMKSMKLTAQQAVEAVAVPVELRGKVLEQI